MTIAILCPTRGRPEGCRRLIESVSKTTTAQPRILFDHRDMMPTAQKWNDLAITAMKDPDIKLFMLGADDMYFDTPGWDKALLDHYNSLENKIHAYSLQDSRDPHGTPHPIVSREWIECMGYAFIPIFNHWQLDTWTIAIAKACGIFTHLKQYRLVHDKPSDQGQGDETHSRIRSWGWRERDAFVAEKCHHFLDVEIERMKKCLGK